MFKIVKRESSLYRDGQKSKRGRCRRNNFTLVEVTMAIAVIAIGMVGIMGLFPIGIQASRDAIGDNYSSQLVQQFLQMVALQAKAYSTEPGLENDGWGEWITGNVNPASGFSDSPDIEVIPSSKASGDNDTDPLGKDNFIGSGKPDKSHPFLGNSDFGIYIIDSGNGVYYLESKSGSVVDFSAAVALWQEDLTYDSDASGVAGDVADDTIDETYGRRLFLEISWPVKVAYKDRQKRYYMLDVFNDNTPRETSP